MKEVYEPLGELVFIKPDEALTKSKGGILIPNSVQEKPLRGTVVAKGKECTVKVGDSVLYGKNSPTQVDEELVAIKESQLMAVIKKKK